MFDCNVFSAVYSSLDLQVYAADGYVDIGL